MQKRVLALSIRAMVGGLGFAGNREDFVPTVPGYLQVKDNDLLVVTNSLTTGRTHMHPLGVKTGRMSSKMAHYTNRPQGR